MSLIALRARLSGRRHRGSRMDKSVSSASGALPNLRLRRLLLVAPSVIASAILVAYHLVLLWQRLTDLSLLQPAVAVRWIVTVGLLIGLRRMQAAGLPLLWGRRALAFWLLVLLLHVSFLGPLSTEASARGEWSSNAGLALVLPAAAPLVLLSTILLTCWLVARTTVTSSRPLRWLVLSIASCEHPSRGGWLPSLASRPPPAFS
jgi:hypothetical protein